MSNYLPRRHSRLILAVLKDKRIVFIFDECHRAQLFGFTGTPIFEANASLQKIEDTQASMRTTVDLFQKQLHAYTITHAINDGNVLRFHIDYFKPEGKKPPKLGEAISKRHINANRVDCMVASLAAL